MQKQTTLRPPVSSYRFRAACRHPRASRTRPAACKERTFSAIVACGGRRAGIHSHEVGCPPAPESTMSQPPRKEQETVDFPLPLQAPSVREEFESAWQKALTGGP